MVLKRDWQFFDGAAKGKTEKVAAGRYEVELIVNPVGHRAPWLVLKGTLIGTIESFLRDFEGPEWGDYEIIIEE